ncbi:MAG: BCD family MFS transporter [Hyphomicrobium sp.]|jgi:BCD family chlorophyll transporter-like MFS transporter|nr:BCD family MFS transporter [Hyphomicrobium sp.]
MTGFNDKLLKAWGSVSPRFLPFADAATAELPLGRLLRLSLFQVTVAMAFVLLNGTLNRVMIVELGVPTFVVSIAVSLPLLFAPFRALVGFKSDTHKSALGWKRAPYIWFGSLLQFGGLAIMPFALLVLSGDTTGPAWIGYAGAALAFLLVGAGLHTTQTAGLALATDIAPSHARPRVVAFLYVMLLLGMVGSSIVFGWLLSEFSQVRLIQVVQGAAALTMVLNLVALWKQEVRDPSKTRGRGEDEPGFVEAWKALTASGPWMRVLVSVALGTAAFSMQDILLEPYGGEVLHLSVGQTTALTGLLAGGTLFGFLVASVALSAGFDPFRLAALGAVAGLAAFPLVIVSAPTESVTAFRAGAVLIGFGSGLFSVGTLTAAMNLSAGAANGLALGAWGAVQASAAGLAIAIGGLIRDAVSALAVSGRLGEALSSPATGYTTVYHIEIILLFATLVAIGPLVGLERMNRSHMPAKFGLAEFPG